jgi:hypothetical protein
MNPKHRSYLAKALGLLFGLFVLYIGYSMGSSEFSLRKYKKAFLQVKHAQGTVWVDSFGLGAAYYPATYADDSIHSKSVYLVGELRGYTGDWREIQAFYSGKALKDAGIKALPLLVLPVEIQSHGQKTLLESPSGFHYGPFDSDMLKALQYYYGSKRMPHREMEGKFYLVYVTPDM